MTAAPPSLQITIVQGECRVAHDPEVTLTTLLGSCIACCLFDPAAAIGGMNHFLLGDLPEGARLGIADSERYGLFAMEQLVNAMLKGGASRANMRAHLYGGANIHAGMRAIGDANTDFARRFLRQDGIRLVHQDTGGAAARRVEFQAARGRARSRAAGDAPPPPAVLPAPPTGCGTVELF